MIIGILSLFKIIAKFLKNGWQTFQYKSHSAKRMVINKNHGLRQLKFILNIKNSDKILNILSWELLYHELSFLIKGARGDGEILNAEDILQDLYE